jgi:hypothetical protein
LLAVAVQRAMVGISIEADNAKSRFFSDGKGFEQKLKK